MRTSHPVATGMLTGPVLEEQLIAHWKTKLVDLPVLTLPTDRPRLPVHFLQRRSCRSTCPWSLINRLKQLSVREGVTLYMKYSLARILQGSPPPHTTEGPGHWHPDHANRNRLEIEDLIGTFVNTLVLRADVTGELTFRDLLRKVRDLSLDALCAPGHSFKLVEELRPDRNRTVCPLVQVLFNLPIRPLPAPRFHPILLDSCE